MSLYFQGAAFGPQSSCLLNCSDAQTANIRNLKPVETDSGGPLKDAACTGSAT